jgi:hypothetical protein
MTSDVAIGMIRTGEYFSLPPLYDSAVNVKHVLTVENIHFPWIHKRDPFSFHFVYALSLPSKNHAAVPLCWAIQKAL